MRSFCRTPAFLFLSAVLSSVGMAKDFTWIEGEQPASANVKWTNGSCSHPDWLSGAKWLTYSIEEGKVDKELPEDGAVFEYALSADSDGKQELWARIGFEFARSAFQWKIDEGDWSTVSSDSLTRDAMELDFFTEAGWLKLGEVALTKGPHKLTFRIPKTKNKLGKYPRVLFGLDCVCLSSKPFEPYFRYQPGENWRTKDDEEAAKQVFWLTSTQTAGERKEVDLDGLWEVCRDDEQSPHNVASPIKELPAHPIWSAIKVPGDRNVVRPDLLFAHRLWYRTRVQVTKEIQGRSYFLVFPQNNLNTTVFVNGTFCGFDKNPLARVQIDITKAIKSPGVNEICVGIRDAWYGRSEDPTDPMKLRRTFNLPEKFFREGFQELAYPIWNYPQSGILQTPKLVAAGEVYASGVFVKPSVSKKQLSAEVALSNNTQREVHGNVVLRAIGPMPELTGQVLAPEPFTLAAGEQKTIEITRDLAEAQLWWPDDPKLYTLRATIGEGKVALDMSDTSFGFREWTIDGIHFKLNGVPFHGWCDQHSEGEDPAVWLAFQRKTNQQMMRFWGASWKGLSPDSALDFFDKNGVVVRRSGALDGESIGYHADEPNPNLRKLHGNSKIKMDLLQNWRDQVCAQVKGERNHPSIMLWSIENEWLYINCINLYGGLMDDFEREETKTSKAVQKIDPTRSTMCDGGAACKDQSLPVCGNHYVTGPMMQYPTLAYDANVKGGGRGRWEWDQKRPRFVGEDWFIAGHHPELATIGGEAALIGKTASLPAAGLATRILQEGYRWADFGAWDFWMNSTDADGSQYVAFAPRAVMCREWNWTFGSEEQAKRTLAIFNDTHDTAPITFTWTLFVGGDKNAEEAKVYSIAPGSRQFADVYLEMPAVQRRLEGEWKLSLAVGGKEVFTDVKPLSVLPTLRRFWPPIVAKPPDPKGDIQVRYGRPPVHSGPPNVYVYDPSGHLFGNVFGFVACERLDDLNSVPEVCKVLLIGKNAIDKSLSTSPKLAALAAVGRTVIVLEQKEPLRYQAIPAEIQPETNLGHAAFVEDENHPAMAGLRSADFFTWGEDEIVYRDAYLKPTRGAKSLIQCGELLHNSALVEVPVEKGNLLLCQLPVQEKLRTSAVARTLLENLVHYGEKYKLTFRPTTVVASTGSQLGKTIDAIGLNHDSATDALAAIAKPAEQIAVIEAKPTNLEKLAGELDKVKAFTEAGGWIVFNGLTPEGLASYNKIVGVDHLIRPFKRELVTFPAVRSPLTAGVSAGDVALYGSQRIFPWREGNYAVSDEFSYVVDFDEVAPFGKSTFSTYDNIVNGFTNADGWPLITNFPLNKDRSPFDIPIAFPKSEEFTELTWIGNTNYWATTKVNLIFNGDTAHPVSFDTAPNGEPQIFPINPARTAKQITLQIAGWQEKPGTQPLLGIDNIYLKVKRSPEFYKSVRPMLNIGGMMEYPRGKGGIVLCNLLFKETEDVPANAGKKRAIFSGILRNLKAPFSGGKTVIVGTNLEYASIDISKQANQFRTERGWFGDRTFTFADLPTGHQTFAGVPFDVFEFATSPVPTAIMLGGSGVPNNLPKEVTGIPVHRKADALFFLQAARIDHRRSDRDIKEGEKWEMARYVVHYTDGQTATIPIYSEFDVDNYRQQELRVLPGAQLAWSKKYEGTQFSAVAYSKQWNNPRPEAEITTVDLTFGADHAGVPALLALTAASRK